MQFHAWLNPLRIQSKGTPSILAPDHLYTQWREDSDPNNDDWVVDWEEGKYFNPAYPEVREKIIEGIREIVENYPVDAIHLTIIFIPPLTGRSTRKPINLYRVRRGGSSLDLASVAHCEYRTRWFRCVQRHKIHQSPGPVWNFPARKYHQRSEYGGGCRNLGQPKGICGLPMPPDLCEFRPSAAPV